MQKEKKVYVVGNQHHYSNFITNHVLVENIKDADIVIFTGGEDVDPSMYNCKAHHSTCSNLERDLFEKKEFEKVRKDQLCVGICRGSQYLCIMNGGLLVQNCSNHAIIHTHPICEFGSSNQYEITSTHHQMQYPFVINEKYWKCLFYSLLSSSYEGDKITNPPYDPEIVLYTSPKLPKCLAIQGHPEYMRKESPIIIKINEIINSLLNEKD